MTTGVFVLPGDLDADIGIVMFHVADLPGDTHEKTKICFVGSDKVLAQRNRIG